MRELSSSAKFLKKMRALNSVYRWNYHPRIRTENVAEHSFWVTLISMELGRIRGLGDAEMGQLLSAALVHDMAEAITGDLPAPVKRSRSWEDVERASIQELEACMPGIPDALVRLVKLADLISAAMYATMEVDMGNTMFKRIRDELCTKVRIIAESGVEHDLLDELGIGWPSVKDYKEMSHL